MLRLMKRPVRCCLVPTFAAVLCLTLPGHAQGNLSSLQRSFGLQRDALYGGKDLPTQAQEAALLQQQTKALQEFLAKDQSPERFSGAILLAELYLQQRDREAAKKTLLGIDPDLAPGRLLLTAADMLAHLGEKAQRDALVKQALMKSMPREERLAMAVVLMTQLREVKQGEQIFAEALAAATDDEARALVRWRRCDALRGREDLPENAWFEALSQLAMELPKTYWGSVARDRNLASEFKLGGESIPFAVTTLDGKSFDSKALRGRGVLLVFWNTKDDGSKDLVKAIATLQQQHGAELAVLGIGLDDNAAAYAQQSTKLGATFPHICDGKGPQTDLALRFGVEITPTILVIDRNGKLAGLNLHVDNQVTRDELTAALKRALLR